MKAVLIDLEFSGLDNTYIKDNEIVQLKMMDVETGKGVCVDYKSTKPVSLYHQVRGMSGEYPGEELFSKEAFESVLRGFVNEGEEVQFFGYSTSTDAKMLAKYSIDVEIVDLQERLRLSDEYEEELAIGCASLEAAYLLVAGKQPPLDTHLGLNELDLVLSIYEKVTGLETRDQLTLMPFGHCAGMPISDYVSNYRRAADGYRFNNSDLLASSLSAGIEELEDDDDEGDSYSSVAACDE